MVLRRVDRLVVGWRDMRKKMAKFGGLESRNRGHKAELIEVKLCRTLYRNYIEIGRTNIPSSGGDFL